MTAPYPPNSGRTPRERTSNPSHFDFSALKARWAAQREASARLSTQLLDRTEREGAAVFRRYRATKAIVFGSLADGRARTRSDIDLVVFGTDPADYWALRRDLEDAFGRPVDLHTESDDPRFVARAVAQGKVVYAA